MMKLLVVGMLLWCSACSSSSSSTSSSTSSSSSGGACCPNGSAQFTGMPGFTTAFVRSGSATFGDGGVNGAFRSLLFSNNGQCTGEGHYSTLQDIRVVVDRPDGLPVTPGTYPVTDENYVWPNDGGVGGPHGESCVVLFEQVSTADGGISVRAASGTVVFTEVTTEHVVGSLDVPLHGLQVTGTFDAPLCNAGAQAGTP